MVNRLTWLRVGGAVLACTTVALGASGCEGAGGAAISVPSTTIAPPPTSTTQTHRPRNGVTGRISAENGTSWVVTTKAGKQMTVTITPGTKFGTAAHPETEQQLTVGSTVRVTGQVDGNAVTATRIAVPQPRPSQSPAPSTTTSPSAPI